MTDQASRLTLKSVRIRNYKCLDDIELSFGDLTLLAGRNGVGKSAVFEVVHKLRQLSFGGGESGKLFPPSSYARWSGDGKQSFALEVAKKGSDSVYLYQISLDRGDVTEELLSLDDQVLSRCFGRMSGGRVFHQPESALDEIRHWWRNIVMFAPSPAAMQDPHAGADNKSLNEIEHMGEYLYSDGRNFARWCLNLMLEEGGDDRFPKVKENLRKILPGFQNIYKGAPESRGGSPRGLVAAFQSSQGAKFEYPFHELSSGQCVLIALYTLIFGGSPNRLLLLDEPDNFVTLSEIQPLLIEMEMEAGDELPQIALISHHPEAIDHIASRNMRWLDRAPETAACVKELKNDTGLRTSELFAQGHAP